jgi:hypothetical protein
MTEQEATEQLASAELVPCAEAALRDAKELLGACLGAGIPALLATPGGCASGGCSPRFQLLVRADDVPRVAALLQQRWQELAAREGTGVAVAPGALAAAALGDGELPCPACGTAAPLRDGACSDCGLQLE